MDNRSDQYAKLEERIRMLEMENRILRDRLGIAADVPVVPAPGNDDPIPSAEAQPSHIGAGGFDQYRSPLEKITLFRTMFRGREDVFARRWQSVKTGKSGYSPVCSNEWKSGVCPKPQGSCANCPQRQLVPLSDEVIFRHLRGSDALGRDVVGIYPILPDDTCRFLTLDLDDKGWQEEAALLRSICTAWDIPCAIERSRSGNGAHLWLFFTHPVPCTDARRLGTTLLTAAMERGGTLKLSAYDRMIPNQDLLPKGGFGNLIALPLQGQARRSGNSVFIDESLVPYDDQWAYLASVRRIEPDTLSALLQQHCRGEALGNLVQSEDNPKPWEKQKTCQLHARDFPQELEIVKSNLFYLREDVLSVRAKNQLVRLAAFRNPDFYRAQAMRFPIYDKPRVISTAETRDGSGSSAGDPPVPGLLR